MGLRAHLVSPLRSAGKEVEARGNGHLSKAATLLGMEPKPGSPDSYFSILLLSAEFFTVYRLCLNHQCLICLKRQALVSTS